MRFFDRYSPWRSEGLAKSVSRLGCRAFHRGEFPLSHPGTANRMRSGELLRYDKVLGVALD